MFDACGQRSGLYRGAVQDAFDGRRIGFAAKGSADLLCDSGAGVGVLQAVLFLPLRADGRGKRFGCSFVAARSRNSGAQRLQHFAVGFVLDTFWQGSGLYRRAIEDAFNGRSIRFTAQCCADLLRDCGAGFRVLQAVLFLPLRANGRGERFCRRFITAGSTNARAQGLQHCAVGFVFDACGQRSGLYRGAVQDTFDRRHIGFTTESGADLLRDSRAGAGVLQTVLFLPLRANGGGKRFRRCFVTAGSANTRVQGLQHFAVGFVLDACGQRSRLYRSAVQDAFDGRCIGFATERSADLLCDGSAGVGVLQ